MAGPDDFKIGDVFTDGQDEWVVAKLYWKPTVVFQSRNTGEWFTCEVGGRDFSRFSKLAPGARKRSAKAVKTVG